MLAIVNEINIESRGYLEITTVLVHIISMISIYILSESGTGLVFFIVSTHCFNEMLKPCALSI